MNYFTMILGFVILIVATLIVACGGGDAEVTPIPAPAQFEKNREQLQTPP